MICNSRRGAEFRRLASALAERGSVAAADAVAPARGTRDHWTIELTVRGDAVPAGLAAAVAAHDLDVHLVQPRPDHVVAIVG